MNKLIIIVIIAVVAGSLGFLVYSQLIAPFNPTSNDAILEITSASIDPSLFWFQVDLLNNLEQANLPQYAIKLEKLMLFNETMDLIYEEILSSEMQEELSLQSKELVISEVDQISNKRYLDDPFLEESKTYFIQVNGIEYYNNSRVWCFDSWVR